jgi:8-oxo-dGTP diphosphatase
MTESRIAVVTVFVTRGNHLLLLRRSDKVVTYKGSWAAVSGYLETEDPLDQAWIEVGEELGIGVGPATCAVVGEPFEVRDDEKDRCWLVHPFRFVIDQSVEPRLDWEHVDSRWLIPDQIRMMDTVPGLWEAWKSVGENF